MEEVKPKKTGPKPKQLVEGTFMGLEVGRGEKKKIIDPCEVEKLASVGLKNSEISEYLDIDDSTLTYNFQRELIKGRHNLKISLRQAMLYNAITNHNAAVQIFLSKNLLGFKDTPDVTESNKILPFTDDLDIITVDSDRESLEQDAS